MRLTDRQNRQTAFSWLDSVACSAVKTTPCNLVEPNFPQPCRNTLLHEFYLTNTQILR